MNRYSCMRASIEERYIFFVSEMVSRRSGKSGSKVILFSCFLSLYLFWKFSGRTLTGRQKSQPSGMSMPADFYSIETAGTLKETEYIIYSRVPKCGSETTLDLMTNTSRLNNVTFEIHQNLKYFEHQQFLVDPRNIGDMMRAIFSSQNSPLLYARHIHYVDLNTPYKDKMTWISLVREPISRKVSEYNYLRWRPTRPHGLSFEDKLMPIQDCFEYRLPECFNTENLTTLTQFFCGYDPICRLDTTAALKLAQRNIMDNFAIVGILERYRDFLQILEYFFPRFFKGIVELYDAAEKQKRHRLNVTNYKHTASNTTKVMMTQKMITDVILHQWLKQRFNAIWNHLT